MTNDKKNWIQRNITDRPKPVVVDGNTIIKRNGEVVRDNLMNLLGRLSNKRDVTNEYNSFFNAMSFLNYTQCENIYLSSGIAKKVVHIPNRYIFKNGFSFSMKGNEEIESKVLELYKELGIEEKIKDADTDERIYGGSVIIVKDPKQDPLQKFDPSLCGMNPERIEFIVRDLSYLMVTANTDYISADYYRPRFIAIAGMQMDASHCILFNGLKVPKRRVPPMKYFGMSVYQNILQALVNDENISKAIANMVWRNTRWYYFVHDLNELVKKGNQQLALDRFSLAEDNINILSACILDGKDSVQLMNQSFQNLDKIDQRGAERLAAQSEIPATILLGKSPDGMNATGDSDFEGFYNYIESEQDRRTPQMLQILEILIAMVTGGKKLPFEFKFNAPNQISLPKQVDIDSKVLDNTKKMEELGMDDDAMKAYMVKRGFMTSKEAETIKEFKKELNEYENMSPEELEAIGKEEPELEPEKE